MQLHVHRARLRVACSVQCVNARALLMMVREWIRARAASKDGRTDDMVRVTCSTIDSRELADGRGVGIENPWYHVPACLFMSSITVSIMSIPN